MNIDRWLFDDSGYYAYLLVDCTEQDFGNLKTLLKERNFSVLAAGKSFRPAVDGRQYSYYVRLGTPVDGRHEKPSKDSVVTALKFSQALSPPASHQPLADTSDVLAEVAELRGQLEVLARSLREVVDRTQSVASQSIKQGKEVQDGLAQIGSRLREERTQIIDSIVSALDTRLGDDERIQQLQKSIAEFRQSETEWSTYNDDLKRLCAEKDERIEVLEQQVEKGASSVGESPQPRVSRQSQVAVFQACLPNVKLIRGCEDVLFFEFSDPTRALEKISALVLSPKTVRGETVEAAKGWLELRCSTGTSNDGRIYFRRDETCLSVLVSKKQEQEADIKYLRNHT